LSEKKILLTSFQYIRFNDNSEVAYFLLVHPVQMG